MILLIPFALADFISLDKEPPLKTNEQRLCVSGLTNSGNTVKFYIDSSQQDIILKDGTKRSELKLTDGNINDLCINLHSGANNVKIISKGEWAEAAKEFITEFDQSPPGLSIDIPDYINNKYPKFTIKIDEPGTLIITVNNLESRVNVNAGNSDIELNLNDRENTIKIETEDTAGNKAVVLDKTITVLTGKPRVTIISVDDKPYLSDMDIQFQYVKINGTTNPGITIKIFNVFDSAFYYDSSLDKVLKGTEEFTEDGMTEQTAQLDKNGNFEEYVALLPGKNTIFFLATDQAGNQNTIASSVNNVENVLTVNYESGENWQLTANAIPVKVKSIDIIKNEVSVMAEIRFSPKNMDPSKLKDVTFSVSSRRDPNAGTNDFNQYIRMSGSTSTPYYNKEKKTYIVYQNLIFNIFPGKIEDIPDKIHAMFDGNIHFYIGDVGKTQSLTESIPIDLLFYVEANKGKYLNPERMEKMSKALKESLNFIEDSVKTLQWISLIDAGACGVIKLINYFNILTTNKMKKTEYLVCDRVLCKDTAPSLEQIGKGYISPGGLYYSPGFPNYHETACLPNIEPVTNRLNPVFSPVRVYDDLWSSTKCVCFTGMFDSLRNVYSTLAALQSCLDEAQLGNTNPAECEIKIAQASCELIFWGIEKKYIQDYRDPYNVRVVGDEIPIIGDVSELGSVKDMINKMNKVKLEKYGFYKAKTVLQKACVNILSQDWSHIEDVAVQTGIESLPSFGRTIVNSWITTLEDKDLAIKYNIIPVIAGVNDLRWELKFKCDPSQDNAYLCQGSDSSRYALDLASLAYNQGTVYGSGFPTQILIEDKTLKYWFNSVELTLTGYITSLSESFEQRIESKIKHTGEEKLKELCKSEDYKNRYEICNLLPASSLSGTVSLTCEGSGGNICEDNQECLTGFIQSKDSDRCCKSQCY